MSTALELVAQSRVLVFAPHPDDESIATGGLLQAARDAGAARRIEILTDGDNNPWPQRWIEKRWRIDAQARARWGARRRTEAHAAMRLLGLAENDARFFGLPDLGLTDLLMRADAAVVESLRREIDDFAPTLLALPSLSDRHPDHSATHVLLRLALASTRVKPRLLAFAVHGKPMEHAGLDISLSPTQRQVKRAAILAHATQMQFSRDRFLRFASEQETYEPVLDVVNGTAPHPLHAALADGALQMHIDLGRWRGSLRGHALFICLEDRVAGSLRWQLNLDGSDGQYPVRNTATGEFVAKASLLRENGKVLARVPAADVREPSQGYIKIARVEPGWRIFDRYGWQLIAR